MHDTLDYFSRDPVHRVHHHHQLTFGLLYAFSENFILPLSHDEVVHGKGSLLAKMPGDRWQQLANLRALYGHMWAHPGKKLLFMGGEFAQEQEWSHERSLDWHLLDAPGTRRRAAPRARPEPPSTAGEPALWERDFDPGGFGWLDADDAAANVLAYARFAADGMPARLRLQPLAGAAARLSDRPAPGRRLARAAQHRRRALRRLGGRQPERRRRGAPLARPGLLGGADAAAARGRLARPGLSLLGAVLRP